jgi:uncharacterized membrane protein YqjE
MTDQNTETPSTGNGYSSEKSAGQLIKEVTEDFSTLFRKEIELAKQEIGQSVGEKAKGAAIVAIAGVLGFFALIFMLLAIRDTFVTLFDGGWIWAADIATAFVLLIIGGLGVLVAKKKLTTPISADMTKQTIKDDVELVKTLGRNK